MIKLKNMLLEGIKYSVMDKFYTASPEKIVVGYFIKKVFGGRSIKKSKYKKWTLFKFVQKLPDKDVDMHLYYWTSDKKIDELTMKDLFPNHKKDRFLVAYANPHDDEEYKLTIWTVQDS